MQTSWGATAHLSRGEIQALQDRTLYSFLNTCVYPFSPHYKRLLDDYKIDPRQIKSTADLKYIPFTSKLDLVSDQNPEKYKEFVLQPDAEKIRKAWPVSKLLILAARKIVQGEENVKEEISREFRPSFLTFTTGTTNKPVPFVYSAYDMNNLHVYGARMIELFNIPLQDRLVNMFPYAPHLAFWQVVCGGLAKSILILSTGGGKVMGTEGNISAILKMKPSVIIGVPGYVYYVLRMAQEKKCRMDFIQKVVLGAGRVTESFKIRLRAELGAMGAKNVSVFGTYGFTEARCAWAECPTEPGVSSGYHVYPDKEIFEVVDPDTGEVKGEGEDGELVYTSLDSRGSVVLRYRTGDFVKGGITSAPCPHCRRTVPRISSDISRISDIKNLDISKIKGQLVNLDHFVACLNEFDLIKDWQLEIRKRNNDPHDLDELVIYVASREGCDKAKLEQEIKSKVFLATEVSPNAIIFVSFEEIVNRLQLETASKEKRILDSRPKG